MLDGIFGTLLETNAQTNKKKSHTYNAVKKKIHTYKLNFQKKFVLKTKKWSENVVKVL